ncbi:NBS1 [Auxenochlorella protothecoides x Auxenochlorella symbiontica]
MTSLWLLEAKEFADDDRPLESRTAKYFLKPGTYSVGRLAGQCDIAVTDDKSISREHAHLWVPGPEAWESEAQGPFIRVSDTSRYGTLVTPTNEGMLARGKDKEAVARHEFYIKFGLKSPFRLYNLEWVAYLLPNLPQDEAQAAARLAVKLGIPLASDLRHPGTRVIAASTAPVAPSPVLLLALISELPVVTVDWLRAWDEHEGVWRHDAPDEAAHPPKLAGSRSVADMNSSLRDLEAQQALKDQAFAWEVKAKDEHLQAVLQRLGGHFLEPALPRHAKAWRILEADPTGTEFQASWTTAQLLLDALWAGTDLLGALQVTRPPADVPAAEEHTGDTTEASEDEGTAGAPRRGGSVAASPIAPVASQRAWKRPGRQEHPAAAGVRQAPASISRPGTTADEGARPRKRRQVLQGEDELMSHAESPQAVPPASSTLEQQAEAVGERVEETQATISFAPLILDVVVPERGSLGRMGGSAGATGLPNYKAFRRRGQAGETMQSGPRVEKCAALEAATTAYTEDAAVSDDFLRQATRERENAALAEVLFKEDMRAIPTRFGALDPIEAAALGPPKPPKRPRAPTARPSRLALAAAAGHQD